MPHVIQARIAMRHIINRIVERSFFRLSRIGNVLNMRDGRFEVANAAPVIQKDQNDDTGQNRGDHNAPSDGGAAAGGYKTNKQSENR